MPQTHSLIPELEDAIQRGSAPQRAWTLSRITDLFLETASRLTDEHVEVFGDVMLRLIVEIETRALAEFAERLAPIANAPLDVLRRLAEDDDVTVAGPVLMQSERLPESDLLAIARSKGQQHLLAISARPVLSSAVTDALLARGDREVLRNIAGNPGARFSEAGLAVLVERAAKDGMLAEKVGERSDVPPHLFRKLLMQATEVVQQRLLSSTRPEIQQELQRILAKVSDEVGEQGSRNFAAAQRAVLALHRSGRLGEKELVEFATGGRYEETVATLSAICSVPVDVVDRLISGARPDPVLILCKAVGFQWATARAVIQTVPRSQPLSVQALDSAYENFERLSHSTAERVLHFWQARDGGTGA